MGPSVADTVTSVWVMDTPFSLGNFRLVRLTLDGEPLWQLPTGQGSVVGVDPRDGSAWVLNQSRDELWKVAAGGRVIRRIPGVRTDPTLVVDPSDGSVWVRGPSEIIKLSADGCEVLRSPGFVSPWAIAMDPRDGSVWVADGGGGTAGRRIVKLNRLGVRQFDLPAAGFTSNTPHQVAIDPRDGSGWYAHHFAGTVVKRSSAGGLLAVVNGLDGPVSVDVDPADGSVWVANFSVTAPAVVKLAANGQELFRTALPSRPFVARVNPDDGSVWVSIEGTLIVLSSSGEFLRRVDGFLTPRGITIARVTEVPQTFASVTRFTGRAIGVGEEDDEGGVQIVGRFTSSTDPDLGASTLTLTNALDEKCGSGELAPGLPVVLSPKAGSTPNVALFENGTGPTATSVEIKDLGQGLFSFRIRIPEAAIGVPEFCTPTDLTTSFKIDSGGTPLVFDTEQPWRCRGSVNRRLTTP